MRNGIVCGGNFILDRVKMIDVYPAQDALANIGEESTSNGGAAYNVALDLCRLGAGFPVEAIGLVGDDASGEYVVQHCRDNGVDVAQLRKTSRAPTSYTDVMTVRGTGRRTFFHQRGANALLAPEHFDFGSCRARHLHLGYVLLLDCLDQPDPEFGTHAARVLSSAHDAGLSTSLDVVSEDSERFASLVPPALAHTDLLFMNEFELGRTTGIPVAGGGRLDLNAAAEAAKRLFALGTVRTFVLHVPDGAVAFSRTGEPAAHGSVSMRSEDIVGSVGAGDAFAAGYLYAWHQGRSVAEALELGVCAAARSLTEAGSSSGIVSAEECLRYGRSLGYRPFPS